MATRPRRPAGSSSTKSASSGLQERSTEADRSEVHREGLVSEKHSEPVPEVRLLGSLHPLPSREERIAISAYWRAAKRQFEPGHELDDWLEAEREVDSNHHAK
ncbi:hypothetical protein HNQ60_002905 [Povalibacter uvarum]|uniref:DUF2934 domain-containing protein n=1 Tax=Povalibacter uvarum TaxID=732238 RepID=A0A841HN53_9GAMM|nr:DUF2934 domain-containing protein [Povalibacter uvarum]MBB6094024.1 hypothetical protein [Povalibacter uvarum]